MTGSIVETVAGPVRGEVENGIHAFRGVPFAAPPVGALRWRPPQPPAPWRRPRDATSFGSNCPQNPIVIGTGLARLDEVRGGQSEDCLHLNVWTPGLDGKRRPVMVWIHGGAFVLGGGAMPLYRGGGLAAAGDVVVVTLNYRLAAFGFMRLCDVTGGRVPATGNEGLLDQVAALEWVRDNIERFGGDADNVTVFGQSAGGISIGALMAMPNAAGLFRRAILQSGACQTAQPKALANRIAGAVLESLKVDADDARAIQALEADRLRALEGRFSNPDTADATLGLMPFQPCIDGAVLPEVPLEAVRRGAFSSAVDVLAGSTLEEYKPYGGAFAGLEAMDHAGMVAALAFETGRLAGRDAHRDVEGLARAYRRAREARGLQDSPGSLFLALEGDRNFWMPGVLLAQAQSRQPGRAFHYVFTWPSPWKGGAWGACHGLDVGFVFANIDATNSRAYHGEGAEADALVAFCQQAWTNFARCGNPSGGLVGHWPEYGARRATMLLGAKRAVALDFQAEERRAWAAAGNLAVGRL